ncbi:solute carrier family 12 member 8 isoform X2 [Vombatus ursinus]|uniref:solute carrier family 12 member 8 isoform X2 n=1 Tax=Vombatus ursinus TaxID=29139 RepID=UPI000FFD0804|nr:solute carrier family 12 member 8 isoform X2 [Vombatus ursinus]
MPQAAHVQELFHEEAHQDSLAQPQPWWKIQLFVWEPVLFGTWDGVFTSCMINIFGVVLFLRTGWLVGNTGVLMGMVLVSFVILVALVTVLSGIGVAERCSVGSGGVYSMMSSVLGGKLGGTFGLLYVFGQCVAGAMYVTGFAESISDLLGLRNIWAVRSISLAVLLGLLGINLAGVKWIVRLQLLLLFLLAVSTLDFVGGSFTHLDRDHGFVGYSPELLQNNTLPDYSPGESFFTVFGVFFPAATGVMAGFNMGGDLREPESNIPIGSLAAVGISWFFYIIFVFLLGAICTRESLRYDFMIAEKVSLVGFLFLLGLYISSLASCMGGLYGAPRILQCIAQEKVVPALAFLGHGRGRNRTPVAAICLTSLVTMAFIFVGQVNVLAPIVTINFMLTYIAIDYSYFSLSMSPCNLNQKLEPGRRKSSRDPYCSERLTLNKGPGYGSEGPFQAGPEGTLLEFTKDLDQIFHLSRFSQNGPGKGEREGIKEKKKVKHPKATKQTLQESFLLDLNSPASPSFPMYSRMVIASSAEAQEHPFTQRSFLREGSMSSSQPKGDHEDQLLGGSQQLLGPDRQDSFPKLNSQEQDVERTPISFYTQLCNPWVSLFGAIGSLTIMFVIQWIYALVDIGVAVILYFYIGQVSPGLQPGDCNPLGSRLF